MEVPGRFYAKLHRPRFYRYKVASPGMRAMRNLYRNDSSSAFIGLAVVAGRFAYCVKWADAKLDLKARTKPAHEVHNSPAKH